MVSSYTTNKAFEKPANGDYVDTWNIPVNGDWDIADRAFGGTYNVSLTNANVTLTQTNCQNVRIRLAGALSANVVVSFPAGVSGFFIVQNATTGIYTVTLASAGSIPGSTTVLTEQGRTVFVFTDGSNVFYADDARIQLSAGTGINITGTTNLTISLQTPVAVANGGTGTTTSTGTGSLVLSASPALTGVPTAPTAASGTSTTQIATTAFVTTAVSSGIPVGVIVMWSGSIGSIPSGWALCNGANGTPDLRDRFVVGAGNTYAVGAMGGSNTVTLDTTQIPSHNHTFSGTSGGMNQNAVHSHSINDPGHSHGFDLRGSDRTGGGNGAIQGPNTTTMTGNGTFASGTGISVNAVNLDHTHNYSGTTSSTGGGLSHENRPPYYALAYIMKI